VSLLAVGEVVRAHKSALAARLIISNPCYLMIDAFKATVEFSYVETWPLENLWTSVDEALASLMKLADKFLMDSL
jgi:hypothetical protein